MISRADVRFGPHSYRKSSISAVYLYPRNRNMGIYSVLSNISWLSSYRSKILFVSFAGLLIPFTGICLLLMLAPANNFTPLTLVLLTLGLTLAAFFITAYMISKLLYPVQQMQSILEKFMKEQKLPELAYEYRDEIGQLMRDMQAALTQLNHLTETKHDVIELISHDLRSPASSILGLIEVLETTKNSDREVMDYCKKIKGLVSKQLALTNNILESLRQEEKLLELRRTNINVRKLLNTAVHMFETLLQQKNLTVHIDVPASLELYGDETQLQEVVNNLLHNAIKFSHRNGRIDTEAIVEQNMLKLSISDNGIGIVNVSPDLLFKRFTRYSRPGTYGEESSGLGLFICKKIVEKHGGTLSVISAGINKGTTFVAHFPC
jgi:signal transduction histidine kinase